MAGADMSNDEVERLRKLRGTALRVRAIARALESSQRQPMVIDRLRRVSGATWRISRAVSGQLRAHPYADFQKDAGTLTILANSLRASAVARFLGRHTRAVGYLAGELSTLSRLLDDARALTCTLNLSDSFGRSQIEIRGLITEIRGRHRAPTAPPLLLQHQSGSVAAADSDWPYLSL
jgi:hypothetical protein